MIAFLVVGLISGGLASSGVLEASQGVDLQQIYQKSLASIECPKVRDVFTDIDTTVTTTNRKLLANTSAKVTLNGVQPPNPRRGSPGYDLILATKDDLGRCLMGPFGDGIVKTFDWSNGTITAELSIPLFTSVEIPSRHYIGLITPFVSADVGMHPGAKLTISPCATHNPLLGVELISDDNTPSQKQVNPYLCQPTSRTSLKVHVDGVPSVGPGGFARSPILSGDPPVLVGSEPIINSGAPVDPYPNSAEYKPNSFTYRWAFSGAVTEPVQIWIDVPLRVGVGTSIPYWALGLGCESDPGCAVSISWGALALLTSPFLMLLAAILLGGSNGESRRLRIAAVTVGIFLIAGVNIRGYSAWGMKDLLWSSLLPNSAIPVIAGWCLIIAALLPAVPRLGSDQPQWRNRLPAIMLTLTAASLMLTLSAVAWQGWREWANTQRSFGWPCPIGIGAATTPVAKHGGILLVGLLLTVTIVGVAVVLYRISTLFGLPGPAGRRSADVTCAVFSAGFLSLGSVIGYAVVGVLQTARRFESLSRPDGAHVPEVDPTLRALTSIGHTLTAMSKAFAVPFLALVALSFVASVLVRRLRARPIPWAQMGWTVGLLLTLAVPFTATGTIPFGIDFPMWTVQAGVQAWIFYYVLRGSQPPRPAGRGERREALKQVRLGAANDKQMADGSEDGQAFYGQRILELGGGSGFESNAHIAARIAAVVAVVPVAYLVWTTVTEASWQSWNSASLSVVFSVITEAVRWLVTGFVFGLVYNQLPTRTGPTKALCYTAVWATGAWAAALMSRMAGVDVATEIFYRTAQFGAFMFVLGLLVDLQAIRRAGGTWRDLRKVYALHDILDVAAVVLPAALLTIALAQQIHAGGSAEVSQMIINGVNDMAAAIRPKGP